MTNYEKELEKDEKKLLRYEKARDSKKTLPKIAKKIIEDEKKHVQNLTEKPKDRLRKLHRLVTKLQMHKCSAEFCFPNGQKHCRHDYPKFEEKQTRMKTVNDPGNPARSYVTQRDYDPEKPENDERYINAYNADLLLFWKANIDVQIVDDYYSLCSYICTYVCKGEPDALRKSIKKALENMPENATIRQRLWKIGNVIFGNREISAQEVIFLLCKLNLVDSSRQVLFTPARYPKKS